jgi:hypothetical protein
MCFGVTFGTYSEVFAQNPADAALGGVTTQPPTTPSAQPPQVKLNEGEGCGWAPDILCTLIFETALAVGGAVTFIGGWMLDNAIYYTILQMGVILGKSSPLGVSITDLWGVLRDLLNIVFIFGLIYIGIKTILDADDSGTQRTLGLLLVSALLVNFSLYFTQVVIDFSNIAAIQVYGQILGSDGQLSSGSFSGGAGSLGDSSISGAFLNIVRASSFFGGGEGMADNMTFSGVLFYSLLMMIFLIMAGMVFAMGAVLLLARFGVLILMMIGSPLMFVSWILPSLGGAVKKFWSWDKLIEKALFPAAFLFMLYLSLVVLQSLQKFILKDGSQLSDALSGGQALIASSGAHLMFFALMIALLYASVKVASSMGIAGASASMNLLGTAQGFAYRNTIGRSFNLGLKGFDYVDKNSGLLKGVNAQRTRNLLTSGRNYNAGGSGLGDIEKEKKELKKARSARHLEETNEAYNKDSVTDLKKKITSGTLTNAIPQQKIDMERAVLDASNATVLEMIKGKDKAQIMAVAGILSDSQAKAIAEDKEIDETVKKAFSDARASQVETRLTQKVGQVGELQADGTPVIDPATGQPKMRAATTADAVAKADVSELKTIGFETVLKNAGFVSAKQIEDWKDLTPTEKDLLKGERKKALIQDFQSGAGRFFKRIENDSERAKLPKEILTDANTVSYLNTNVLSKIVDNESITETERNLIKQNILSSFPQGANTRNNAQFKKYSEFFGKNQAGMKY